MNYVHFRFDTFHFIDAFDLQQLEETMRQIKTTVAAEGYFLDILARIHYLRHCVFLQ